MTGVYGKLREALQIEINKMLLLLVPPGCGACPVCERQAQGRLPVKICV